MNQLFSFPKKKTKFTDEGNRFSGINAAEAVMLSCDSKPPNIVKLLNISTFL